MVIKFACFESRFTKMGVDYLAKLVKEAKASNGLYTLEATVVTGFESQAMDECKEKCKPVDVCKGKGRIFFNVEKENYHKVLTMRSIDNLFLVSEAFGDLQFTREKEKDLEIIKELVHKVDWSKYVSDWAEISGFKGVQFPKCAKQDAKELEGEAGQICQRCLAPNGVEILADNTELEAEDAAKDVVEEVKSVEEVEVVEDKKVEEPPVGENPASGDYSKKNQKKNYWKRRREEKKTGEFGKKKVAKKPPKPYVDDGILKFRVTCYRNGQKHSFDSNDAAMHFGGLINDEFHWTVDLTRFDINVVLVIEDQCGYVTYGLTKSSFHRRNITHFGPTTLRATMCYSLMRLADPKVGDIVLDPMCGGGSIPIEGSIAFPNTFQICGDVNDKCLNRTRENIAYCARTNPLKIDSMRLNAKILLLRDQSVDIAVTDLPFGLRMGKWKDNVGLYSSVLKELARVVRWGSGKAVVLTYDKAAMIKALRNNGDLWKETRSVFVNQGGLKCIVYLLTRRPQVLPETAPTTDQVAEKLTSALEINEPKETKNPADA